MSQPDELAQEGWPGRLMLGGARCCGNAQKEAAWWAVIGRLWEAVAESSLVGATKGI